jgi:hypothetical protein
MTTQPAAAPPTKQEIDAETNPARKAVLAAMARMLTGTPTIARPGLLSKAGLAREAQVDRNRITQGNCRDLGDRLLQLAQERIAPATAREAEQQARIDQLTELLRQTTDDIGDLRHDRDTWKAATHTLLRAVQVMRLEHTQLHTDIRVLKQQLTTPHEGTGLVVVPPVG